MKRKFIIAALLISAFCANGFAQNSPKNATDFFLNLPNEYLGGTKVERRGFLGKKFTTSFYVDFLLFDNAVPNFLRDSIGAPQSMGQLKLFRGKQKTIVGLSYQVSDGNEKNSTVDSTKWTTLLLEYKGGKWSNVTETVMPKVSVDYAYKVLTEAFLMKSLKKDDVRVETQLNRDKDRMLFVARIKGDDSVTILKLFKWNGIEFVESEFTK